MQRYLFVSSISVYADFSQVGMDETSVVAELTPEQRDTVATIDESEPMKTPAFLELYGPLKAECERVVDACRQVLPPPTVVAPDHYARCIRVLHAPLGHPDA